MQALRLLRLLPAMLSLAAAAGAQVSPPLVSGYSVSISGPLVPGSSSGVSTTPSREIIPGAANLLAPNIYVAPIDPTGARLESTRMNPSLARNRVLANSSSTIDVLIRGFEAQSFKAGFSESGLRKLAQPGLDSTRRTAPSSLFHVSRQPAVSYAANLAGGTQSAAGQPPAGALAATSARPDSPAPAPLPQNTAPPAVPSGISSQRPLAGDSSFRRLVPATAGHLERNSVTRVGLADVPPGGVLASEAAGASSPLEKGAYLPQADAAIEAAAGHSPFRDPAQESFLSPSVYRPVRQAGNHQGPDLGSGAGGRNYPGSLSSARRRRMQGAMDGRPQASMTSRLLGGAAERGGMHSLSRYGHPENKLLEEQQLNPGAISRRNHQNR